jgi:hypothetical protein
MKTYIDINIHIHIRYIITFFAIKAAETYICIHIYIHIYDTLYINVYI